MKKGDWFFMRQQRFIDGLLARDPGNFNMVCALWGMGPLMDKRERELYPTMLAIENFRYERRI